MITVDTERELPRNWVYPELGDICEIKGGFAFKSKDYQSKGIPLVRISNIKDEGVHLDTGTVYLDKSFKETASDFLLQKGDILIALSGATTGKYGVFALDKATLLNQRVGRLRLYSYSIELPLKYIFYYLGIIKRTILGQAYGAAQPNISTNELARFKIPFAPVPEQKRIVAKIEELFTKLDAGIEALKKIKAQLKRYRQAVLKHAFEGKLTAKWRQAHKGELEPASKLLERIAKEREKNTKAKKQKKLPPLDTSKLPELPEGWAWARVKEIGEIVTGTTPSKKKTEYYGNDFPFYKPTDLNAGYYVRTSADSLSTKGLEKARLLPEKSILVTCIGATIGKTGFIRSEGASNQQINAIIPLGKLCPEYIYYACISLQFQKKIFDNASATTLPILNKGKFELLVFPVSSFTEQRKIVEEIERHFSIADQIEQTIEQGLKQSAHLRQSILKKAFEGKLVPQDPEDEPAEKLLERIKAEKDKQKNKKEDKVKRLTKIRGK